MGLKRTVCNDYEALLDAEDKRGSWKIIGLLP
jgi:hypothetical protein